MAVIRLDDFVMETNTGGIAPIDVAIKTPKVPPGSIVARADDVLDAVRVRRLRTPRERSWRPGGAAA